MTLSFFAAAQIDVEDPIIQAPNLRDGQANIDRIEWIELNGLYGFKNVTTDQVIINPEYEYIDLHFSDFMVAQKKGQTGVINKKGEIVVPFEFQQIKISNPNKDIRFPLLLAQKKDFWGLIEPSGRMVVPFEWPEATFYYPRIDSFVLLSRPGFQRLINRLGETVIETHFDRWENGGGIDRKKYIYARHLGKVGLADFQINVVLPFKYEQVMWVYDDIADQCPGR